MLSKHSSDSNLKESILIQRESIDSLLLKTFIKTLIITAYKLCCVRYKRVNGMREEYNSKASFQKHHLLKPQGLREAWCLFVNEKQKALQKQLYWKELSFHLNCSIKNSLKVIVGETRFIVLHLEWCDALNLWAVMASC